MAEEKRDITFVRVIEDGEESTLAAPVGANLRELLYCPTETLIHSSRSVPGLEVSILLSDSIRERGHSPYTRLTERANCGGNGLCGTCGVRVREGPEPDHWHDGLAETWGYPRLSCQITVEGDMTVEIPEKIIWGRREPGWF